MVLAPELGIAYKTELHKDNNGFLTLPHLVQEQTFSIVDELTEDRALLAQGFLDRYLEKMEIDLSRVSKAGQLMTSARSLYTLAGEPIDEVHENQVIAVAGGEGSYSLMKVRENADLTWSVPFNVEYVVHIQTQGQKQTIDFEGSMKQTTFTPSRKAVIRPLPANSGETLAALYKGIAELRKLRKELIFTHFGPKCSKLWRGLRRRFAPDIPTR